MLAIDEATLIEKLFESLLLQHLAYLFNNKLACFIGLWQSIRVDHCQWHSQALAVSNLSSHKCKTRVDVSNIVFNCL